MIVEQNLSHSHVLSFFLVVCGYSGEDGGFFFFRLPRSSVALCVDFWAEMNTTGTFGVPFTVRDEVQLCIATKSKIKLDTGRRRHRF